MAFGSFSTPAGPKTVAGYQTPQTLFAGMPTGPGVTTSNMVASMPIEGMDVQDQAAAYALQQRMKADREDEWARAAAANRARMRPKQTGMSEQDKLRSAFNEMYSPQIAAKGHDIRMSEDSPAGRQRRQQYDRLPGGAWASGTAYQTGKMPHFDYDQNQTRRILDQMWRQQTDPYWRAAASMGGGTLKAMTPGGTIGGRSPYTVKE